MDLETKFFIDYTLSLFELNEDEREAHSYFLRFMMYEDWSKKQYEDLVKVISFFMKKHSNIGISSSSEFYQKYLKKDFLDIFDEDCSFNELTHQKFINILEKINGDKKINFFVNEIFYENLEKVFFYEMFNHLKQSYIETQKYLKC